MPKVQISRIKDFDENHLIASKISDLKMSADDSDLTESGSEKIFKCKKFRKKKKRLGISLTKIFNPLKKIVPPRLIVSSSDSDLSIVDRTPSEKFSSDDENSFQNSNTNQTNPPEEINDEDFMLPMLSMNDPTHQSDSLPSLPSPVNIEDGAFNFKDISKTKSVATKQDILKDHESDRSILSSGSDFNSFDDEEGIKCFYGTTMFQDMNKTFVNLGVRCDGNENLNLSGKEKETDIKNIEAVNQKNVEDLKRKADNDVKNIKDRPKESSSGEMFRSSQPLSATSNQSESAISEGKDSVQSKVLFSSESNSSNNDPSFQIAQPAPLYRKSSSLDSTESIHDPNFQISQLTPLGQKGSNLNATESDSSKLNTLVRECPKVKANLHFIGGKNDSSKIKYFAPIKKPPNKDEVLFDMHDYKIPFVENIEPFYSNIKDNTGRKEIGGTVLSIKSKSVKDLEEFQSNFPSICSWRQEVSKKLFFTQEKLKQVCNSSIFASERKVVITSVKLPPTFRDAYYWLKGKALLKGKPTRERATEPTKKSLCAPAFSESNQTTTVEAKNDEQICNKIDSNATELQFEDTEPSNVEHSTPNFRLTVNNRTERHEESPNFTPVVPIKRKFSVGLSRVKSSKKFGFSRKFKETLPLIMENPVLTLDRDTDSAKDNSLNNNPPNISTEGNSCNKKLKTSEVEECAKSLISDTFISVVARGSQSPSSINSEPDHMLKGVSSSQESQNKSETSINSDAASSTISPNSSLHKKLLNSQFRKELRSPQIQATASCCIDGPSPNNSGNFRRDLENLQEVKTAVEHQYLTVLVMELHASTRGDLRPDPDFDPIEAIFYSIINDVPPESGMTHETGVIFVSTSTAESNLFNEFNCQHHCVEDEKSLIKKVVSLVKKWDPDILAGYEIEMLSWSYLIQRAYACEINLLNELSRVKYSSKRQAAEISLHLSPQKNLTPQKNADPDPKKPHVINPEDKEPEIRLTGRIVFNVWRLLRTELNLQSYSFENIMYHVLHQRIPLHSFKNLTLWWNHRSGLYRWITMEYYLIRVEGIVKILDQLDLVGRTAELARLFGILFYEVLSRGSQFRVESMMLRLAKPFNCVAVSPSIQQRAHMRAPESLPLIMEPESRFYKDPVIVLDFQSLYPSIIIAYNYCFSTCLGRVEHLADAEIFEFGCTQLRVPFSDLVSLEDKITIAPCGSVFVQKEVRKGLLPAMLEEILETRLMVKQSMKLYKSNKILQRVLHSRQLGLKLIANVTYGYTAANFSGRMPCIEIGDSVVSKGRETLGRAIELVNSTPKWGSRVIYGDTDSLFVLVPGRSRKDAFKIGAEIAEAVTNANPSPVKLKLEKVYQPCILQTKKRYVGYMYESPDQEKPTYDAKGIETVRRDGCPAVAKILEKCLRMVFETSDISLMRRFICKQFSKIITGRVSIQDVTFAREYRGAVGYKPGACVPALQLAQQWLAVDPRSEPRVAERVPYVVIAGPPGLPIIRLVRSPHELLADPSLKINAEYYITRVIIPPLDRCFSLLGVNIFKWYTELPRKAHTYLPSAFANSKQKATISQYFATMNCVVCNEQTHAGICVSCQPQSQLLAVTLMTKINTWGRKYDNCVKICQTCCGRPHSFDCVSLDCPVIYRRAQTSRDQDQIPFLCQLQESFLDF